MPGPVKQYRVIKSRWKIRGFRRAGELSKAELRQLANRPTIVTVKRPRPRPPNEKGPPKARSDPLSLRTPPTCWDDQVHVAEYLRGEPAAMFQGPTK